jgi:hypothetical protein
MKPAMMRLRAQIGLGSSEGQDPAGAAGGDLQGNEYSGRRLTHSINSRAMRTS